MMCCGVLPIDQMRDHITPINLILSRVPKEVLETQYKIYLPPANSSKYTTQTFLQVYASKKGWRTGSGTPAEMHAAKYILKDYTTGRLLHCQLRPDFNPEVHPQCQTSGYNLDLNELSQPMPSAQNYEEIKEEDETVESEATTNLGDTTTLEESKDTMSMITTGGAAQSFQQAEDDFDAQFFGRKVPKMKLNKGEKRQLKYALKAGVNINEVGDLKTYLDQQIRDSKKTHNTPVTVAQAKKNQAEENRKAN